MALGLWSALGLLWVQDVMGELRVCTRIVVQMMGVVVHVCTMVGVE